MPPPRLPPLLPALLQLLGLCGAAARPTDAPQQPLGADLATGKLGYLVLKNTKNTQYSGVIGIGTPPQMLSVIFDTGSNSLVLTSDECVQISCLMHNRFKPGRSSSYAGGGRSVTMNFAGGSVEGPLGFDVVSMGGLEAPKQSLLNIASHSVQGYAAGAFDGILGIGMEGRTNEGETAVLHSLGVQQFSIWLSSRSGEDGMLVLGGTDSQYHTGPFVNMPVADERHWAVTMDDVAVGGRSIGACEFGAPCRGILDTGTSLITGPSAALTRLTAGVSVAPDCSNFGELPNVSFVMAGEAFTLQPEHYVLDVSNQVLSDSPMLKALFSHLPSARCMLAMQPLDLPGEHGASWILGDPFLRAYYSHYDRASRRVGLAPARATAGAGGAGGTRAGVSLVSTEPPRPMAVDVSAIVPPTLDFG